MTNKQLTDFRTQPMDKQPMLNNDMQELPKLPVYDDGELKPSQAFDVDGTIAKRLQFIKQETDKVMTPLTEHYEKYPKCSISVDARLFKRLCNFFTWFDEVTLAKQLEPVLRPIFEAMQGANWPDYEKSMGNELLEVCEDWGWVDGWVQSNEWPVALSEDWVAGDSDETPKKAMPDVGLSESTKDPAFRDFITHPDRYGHNGLKPGQMFSNRKAAVDHGAHACRTQNGVGKGCNTTIDHKGVYSIIITDSYGTLNNDQGEVILYAGPGALNSDQKGKMHKTKKWIRTLQKSADTKDSPPVRVLRKYSTKNPHAPRRGGKCALRYDGLYNVVSRKHRPRNDNGEMNGALYEEFRLERIQPSENGNGDEVQGTLEQAQKNGETADILLPSNSAS